MKTKNIFFALPVPILDLAFLVIFFLVFQSIFVSTASEIDEINSLIQKATAETSTMSSSELIELNATLEGLTQSLILATIKLFFAATLLWLFTHGQIWFLVAKVLGTHVHYKTYALKSAIISIITWLLIALTLVSGGYALKAGAEQAGSESNGVLVGTGVVLLVILWLSSTAYAICAKYPGTIKHQAKLFGKNIHRTVIPTIVFIVGMWILGNIITTSGTSSLLTLTLEIVLLLLPFAAASRLLLVYLIKDTHERASQERTHQA